MIPLVLLTALQSSFQADPSSSDYVLRPAPRILDDGTAAFGDAVRAPGDRIDRRAR